MSRQQAESAMTPVPPVYAAMLEGRQLVEASAGTGKTWTISGLYLRLLLEQGAEVRQILTLTFNIAAAAELRERIRGRIRAVLNALNAKGDPRPDDDPFVAWMLEQIPDRELASQRLLLALRSFDEARIHTIHGFCQRALSDHAFRSGSAFQCEVIADPGAIVHEVAADFWRCHIASGATAGIEAAGRKLFVRWIASTGASVEELERLASRYARRAGVQIKAPDRGGDLAARLSQYDAAWQDCRRTWLSSGDGAIAMLRDAPNLDRKSYRKDYLASWQGHLGALLASESPRFDLPKGKALERISQRGVAEKSRGAPVSHPLFTTVDRLVDAAGAAVESLSAHWTTLRLEFIRHAGAEIPRRLEQRKLQSFDDLLHKLDQALRAESGGSLAAALRAHCPYALIDEFQDTDPLQWGIVEAIYGQPAPDSAVFLVGDPKQAIYSFRGADVYAYLSAASTCGEPLRLLENQRSVPGLVQALNQVFGLREDPFRHPAIRYVEVQPSTREKRPLIEEGRKDEAPLRIALAGPADSGKLRSRDSGRDWATERTANEIARLLSESRAGRITLGKDRLAARDIAVLTNTNHQAAMVRRALADRGISSAELSTQSVFESPEAEALQRVLMAISTPRDSGAIRAALLSDLVGLDAAALLELEDDRRWEAVLAEFAGYYEAWSRYGVMRALRELFRTRQTYARLAQYRNGERRLTNVYHLGEILNLEEQRRHGKESLLSWLAARREDRPTEDMQLRLDSDANLVQIVTIHRSKGLEYPVTFVPFLWDSKSYVDDEKFMVLYHGDAPEYRLILDGRDRAANLPAAIAEELGEKMRLAYVALTRAVNRCYLFTGAMSGANQSALNVLLSAPESANDIEQLCRNSGGTIRLFAPSSAQGREREAADKLDSLSVRELRHRPRAGYVQSSFSGLQRAAQASPSAESAVRDHDELVPVLTPDADAQDIRDRFQGGAAAGDCLHRILEHIERSSDKNFESIRTELRRSGFDEGQAGDVEAWMREVLATPIALTPAGTSTTLAVIAPADQIRELGFHLAAPQFVAQKLVEVAQGHGVPMQHLQAGELHGYVNGSIDLAFRHQGRWYLADYKSNRLGAIGATCSQADMERAMAAGNYHLQYLIYAVALHRWLRTWVPGYDYDRHFGGVRYLFLRGMRPDWVDEQGQPRGVYACRPDRGLIDALDACFGVAAATVAA